MTKHQPVVSYEQVLTICATGLLSLPSCSGVRNPKTIPCFGTKDIKHMSCSGDIDPSFEAKLCIVSYRIVSYHVCILL